MNDPLRSPAVLAALVAYDTAAAGYLAGRDSASVLDLPKLALADAVLAAIAAASADRRTRLPGRGRPILAAHFVPRGRSGRRG